MATKLVACLFIILAGFAMQVVLASDIRQSEDDIFARLRERPIVNAKTIAKLVRCESGGRNIKHLDTNNRYSYGILQIQQATWDRWSKESGIIGHPMNEVDSILLSSWALENGKGREWTCYRKLNLK